MNPDTDVAIFGVAVGLFLLCALYARILAMKEVQEWYNPRRTWVTVAVGNGIIWGGFIALALMHIIPWVVPVVYIIFQGAAGTPIILWQYHQNVERDLQLARSDNKSRDQDVHEDQRRAGVSRPDRPRPS